jgi:hypothetical protein
LKKLEEGTKEQGTKKKARKGKGTSFTRAAKSLKRPALQRLRSAFSSRETAVRSGKADDVDTL